jgi:tripartite-type tricarboxylate transporter receptor subunit TctC
VLLASLAPLCPAVRAADRWPQRPVRLVVAYPPGGISDEISRVLADRLAARVGVPVLVQHRAGAGGSLAMDMLAHAAPDGHTLCFSAISPLSLLPLLGPVPYHPQRDIQPVISVMHTPVLVVGTPALEARDFAAMLDLARAAPGSLRWATSGRGTTGHLVLEHVRQASGTEITHVPYKGGGQQLNDALGGQFEVLSSNVAATPLQYIRSGRLQALAVGAPMRLSLLPGVPTLAELGFATANRTSLFGVFAPGGTPPALVSRLNAEIGAVLGQAHFRTRLLAVNNLPAGGSADAFGAQIDIEMQANRKLLGLGSGTP